MFDPDLIQSPSLWERIKCRLFGTRVSAVDFGDEYLTTAWGYSLGGRIYIFDTSQIPLGLDGFEQKQPSGIELPDGWRRETPE